MHKLMLHPAPHARSHWSAILLIVGAGIVSALQVGKASTALAAVQADLGMSLATASWLISAFAIIGAIIGAPIGLAADRVGSRLLIIGGLVAQGLASALGAVSASAGVLLLTRAVEGIGFLAVIVAAPAMIVAVAPSDSRERAVALWSTFMPIGMTLALLSSPILTWLQWRGFWLCNAAILIVYAAVFFRLVEAEKKHISTKRSIWLDIRDAAASPGPWGLGLLFTAFSAAFFAVFGFLPTILVERLNVNGNVAGMLTAIAIAASGVGNIVGGYFLTRGVLPRLLLVASFGVMALCAFVILGDDIPGSIAYSASILFSFISGLIPVVIFDSVSRYAPRTDLDGATIGFAMQGNNIGLLIGPVAAGGVAASFGWSAVAPLVALICLAAIALTATMFRGAVSAPAARSGSTYPNACHPSTAPRNRTDRLAQ